MKTMRNCCIQKYPVHNYDSSNNFFFSLLTLILWNIPKYFTFMYRKNWAANRKWRNVNCSQRAREIIPNTMSSDWFLKSFDEIEFSSINRKFLHSKKRAILMNFSPTAFWNDSKSVSKRCSLSMSISTSDCDVFLNQRNSAQKIYSSKSSDY